MCRMRSVMRLMVLVAVWLAAVGTLRVFAADSLEVGFIRPPRGARPQTWYHLMNGNVTREGLVRDLDAMADVGLGGLTMFDAGCGIPPGPLRFGTPEWQDFLAFAAQEAAKRDLEIILPNCSGWSSSGGPWIGETNCMKEVVLEESDVPGGVTHYALPKPADARTRTVAVLAYPIPAADLATEGPYAGFTLQISDLSTHSLFAEAIVEASDDGENFRKIYSTGRRAWGDVGDAYRVPRYFPFPKPVSAKHLRVRVENRSDYAKLKGKATFVPQRGRRLADVESKRFAIHQYGNPRETLVATADQVVPKASVVDLTASLSPDGTLTWSVPTGRWRVLRVGWRPQNTTCCPASEGGLGLEVDKLDAKAVDYHFDQYVGRVADGLGPKLAGKDRPGFAGVLTDSYEVGMQNWTDGFEKTFVRRAGYDPTPWYPVFAGTIVDSIEASERFLEDYRRVLSDSFAENYADEMAAACHRRGLAYESEPYGNFPADYLRYGEKADIPMAEFWSRGAKRHLHVGNAKLAAYLAHVWGRRYVATESFTAGWPYAGRFRTTPRFLKPQGDLAFASGVNRINYHRFAHQPWPDGPVPGMTMGKWGMNFDRTLTWWYDQKPWIEYQSRCQWMLQEGTFVADLLYYQGEDLPVRAGSEPPCERVRSTREGYPSGHDYDWCAREALLKLRVEDGRLVVPGGVRYALLVLPDTDTMSFEILEKLASLLDQGAKVCAPRKPVRFPGLKDWPAKDAAFARRVNEVWAKGVMELPPAEALAKIGCPPDVVAESPKADFPEFAFIHRTGAIGDWYFVARSGDEPVTMTVSFRQSGHQVELWNAETGEIVRARRVREEKGRTFVTLDLGPDGSTFVVFRDKSTAAPEAQWTTVSEQIVKQPWTVKFPNGFRPNAVAKGPEETLVFTNLVDWTRRPEKDVNYFSGTATYETTLNLENFRSRTRTPNSNSIILDLGDVRDFATVTVGDKTYPTLWHPPYRLDITDAVEGGKAEEWKGGKVPVTVRVTNLWINRLIGDEREYGADCEWNKDGGIVRIPDWVSRGEKSPTGRHAFCTWRHWTAGEKLVPSGLIGPVILRTERSDVLPPSRYFTDAALATADLAGLREESEALVAKAAGVLAQARALAEKLSEEDKDAVLKRAAITERLVAYIDRRLKDGRDEYLLVAWQGAMELKVLLEYFGEEEIRYRKNRELTGECVLKATDFGVVADGTTDVRASLQRALDAAQAACDGKTRVRLELPPGRLAVGFDEAAFPAALVKRNFRPAHLWLTNAVHLTVAGEGTTLVFRDATHLGIRVVDTDESTFCGFTIEYAEDPSTQGTVVAVGRTPCFVDVAIDPGKPAPDSPRFLQAPSRRFTLSDAHGFVQGTAVLDKVVPLPGTNGVYRFTPAAMHASAEYWQKPRVGDRLSVIARYDPIRYDASAIDLRNSRFCMLRDLTVHDSPGVDFRIFNTYATKLVGCTVRPRPGDLVSSDADGCQVTGLIGPYVARCHFEGMEDDGFNFHSPNPELEDLSDDRLTAKGLCGVGAFVTRPTDGKVRAVLRRGAGGRLTRPAPEGLVTAKGIRRPDDVEKNAKGYFGSRAKDYRRADRCVKIPSDLNGTVVVDTEFRNVRGMGLQADAPNLWFENVRCKHTTNGGINVTGLLSWGMNFAPHNVVLKDCFLSDSHNYAVAISLKVMAGIPKSDARPIQGVLIDNCTVEHRWPEPVLYENCADVTVTNLVYHAIGD